MEAAGEWHLSRMLFPGLKGAAVLDLGRGYGWHSKYVVDCGAVSVLGIDLSERMIAEAIQKNADEKITYKVIGLEEYDYPANTYDCVIANLVVHYIKDLNTIYERVYSTLRVSGVFLFNIEHPVFTAGISEDWVYDTDGKSQYWR